MAFFSLLKKPPSESLFWKEDWCAHRTPYSWHSAATHAMLREGEKIREQSKAGEQVDEMLLALPSRPEMRPAANSMENGASRPLSVLSRIRHIQVLFPI
jgi:hypothetical protein